MRAVMVMFDSLNRHMLPNYGCDWIKAPNFKRLAKKTVSFDNCYAGSLPCMPARRELHTGRYNFLHRSWGPVEPFDDSMPELLKRNGIYTHLVSDHQHYWEDGGCTYHTRYSSWEISRGQEGDPWKGRANYRSKEDSPFFWSKMAKNAPGQNILKQDEINRTYLQDEKDMPQAVTFKNGIDFINANHDQDNWFLQIETFDPHEPFFAPARFQELYPDDYNGIEFDWPPYGPVMEDDRTVAHGKNRYSALVSMCDHYLGKVLDLMDEHNLWEDTMLIVNTDHGYLLGEHGWWSKSVMPTYNEIAHIPFFIYDPRLKIAGEKRQALVQTIDIAPTLLDFFKVAIPEAMEGRPLKDTVASNKKIRDHAMFGYHGSHVNITDGHHVYMRSPVSNSNRPLYEYTLMPTHMRSMFAPEELGEIEIAGPFGFSNKAKMMRIEVKAESFNKPAFFGSKLFDIDSDPDQLSEIENEDVELAMIEAIRQKMIINEAPDEQYVRLGIVKDRPLTRGELRVQKEQTINERRVAGLESFEFQHGSFNMITCLLNLLEPSKRAGLVADFKVQLANKKTTTVKDRDVYELLGNMELTDDQYAMYKYFVSVASRTK